MSDYDDSNRAFLQAFLARSALTLDTVKPILAAIFSVHEGREVLPSDVNQDDLNSFISAANSKLSPLDLEIRSTIHQQSRERWYALVNTTSDPLTQLATTYTAEEISYVKRLLDSMFDGQNNRGKKEAMCISGMEAVQLAKPSGRRDTQAGASQGAGQGLTLKEAETMLGRLLEEGWLEKSPKGFYSLSPRALMELKNWLVDTYNDPPEEGDEDGDRSDKIKFCHACKDIITVVRIRSRIRIGYRRLIYVQGQRCSRRECPCRLHDICTQSFFRMRRSQTCPLCDTAWDGKTYVGEKAITTSESYLKGKRRSTNQRRPAESEINEQEAAD